MSHQQNNTIYLISLFKFYYVHSFLYVESVHLLELYVCIRAVNILGFIYFMFEHV